MKRTLATDEPTRSRLKNEQSAFFTAPFLKLFFAKTRSNTKLIITGRDSRRFPQRRKRTLPSPEESVCSALDQPARPLENAPKPASAPKMM